MYNTKFKIEPAQVMDVSSIEINPSSLADENLTYTANIKGNFNFESDGLISSNIFDISKSNKVTMEVIVGFKKVQLRKHRKKRINKKYAKKYGYEYVAEYKNVEANVLEIKSDDLYKNIEFIFDMKGK